MEEKLNKIKAMLDEMRAVLEGNEEAREEEPMKENEATEDPMDMSSEKETSKALLAAKLKKKLSLGE